MLSKDKSFTIGAYRPIYLWGGPGTIRMNKLKFLGVDVDEKAHHEVHTPEGAKKVLEGLYCNWVHLMYNWGFPPEVEAEDWDSFAQGAQAYHERGSQVFAYIQSSNCVFDGSFMDKEWYALDPKGGKITYFTFEGRYMVCLANPEWKQHLKDLIRGAIERGADGIFFDNMYQGAMTVSMLGTWMGPVGCHCSNCRQEFNNETTQMIPTVIDTEDHNTVLYLKWRADQVTQLIRELADFADELQPGTPISGNDYNFMTANSYILHGLDLAALAEVQDVTMIENFALPNWEEGPEPRLANNALNIRTARELVREKAHLSMLAYDVAIGTDPVYPIRRYKQGIAEALACGTSTTTKGTEYFDGQKMTVITASEYAEVCEAIGEYNRWLSANSSIYNENRTNLAPIGLLYPEQALWLDWHKLAPLYFNVGQALTMEGIPWRVVRLGDPLKGLKGLLVFDEPSWGNLKSTDGLKVVFISDIPGWQRTTPTLLSRNKLPRQIVSKVFMTGMKIYGKNKLVRRLADKFEVSKIVNCTFSNIPTDSTRKTLLATLPEDIYPRLESKEPCLIEVWEHRDDVQIHLVNYASQRQEILIQFDDSAHGIAISSDGEDIDRYEGNPLRIPVDIYKILTLSSK
jgi:hypothetical protein